MGTRTPWGMSDSSKRYARGVVSYTTPGHGGFHLSKTMNSLVHSAWRKANGWYEEDCEWAIVALTFPHLFRAPEIAAARSTAKSWYPDGFEAFTGEKVKPEESIVLRERIAKEAHKNDYVVTAAWGSWHKSVPAGMVGVVATLGGSRTAGTPEKWFTLPEGEYETGTKSAIGFVINPATATEVEKFA